MVTFLYVARTVSHYGQHSRSQQSSHESKDTQLVKHWREGLYGVIKRQCIIDETHTRQRGLGNRKSYAGKSNTVMDPALAEAWKHSLGGTASQLMRGVPAHDAQVDITVPQVPVGANAVSPVWPAAVQSIATARTTSWYRHTVFIQFCTCVAVFLAVFILLVAVRPPFMYRKPTKKLGTEEFVPLRGFYIAFAAAVMSALCMLALAMMSKYKIPGFNG